jgi:outer membrane protein
LTLSQTIYNGGRSSSFYRQSLASRDSARASLNQTVAVVLQSVGAAWSNIEVAKAGISASDRQIRSAQTAYDGVKEEAKLGSRTTLDVLNAEQELLSARTARLSAQASYYIGVYTLLSRMGLLTVDHLKLGIATYDPEAYYNAVKSAPATSSQGKRLDRVLKSIGKY